MTSDNPTPHPHFKTHCIRGHDLAVHGRPHKNGGRVCRECNALRNRVDYVPDPKPPIDHDEVVRLYRAGVQIRQIVADLGISTATVYRVIKKAGVPKRKRKHAMSNADIEAAWAELMDEQTGETDD